MNILYSCSEYPPFRNGGIGSSTKIVAEEMAKRGHKIFVVGYYTDLTNKESEEVINGVHLLRFNLGYRRGRVRQNLFYGLNKLHLAGFFIQRELDWFECKIDDLIIKKKIDLLELTDYYGFNAYLTRLKYRHFSIPVVLRVHGSESFLLQHAGLNNRLALKNDYSHFLRSDWLCSVSQYSENYIIKTFPSLSFKGKKIIYNPLETSFFKNNNPSMNKTILFIGKLVRTKGAYVLVEAFGRIHKDFPEWSLKMIGGGDVKELQKSISLESKKYVSFLGFCDRKTIIDEIDKCAFACIPSFFENFSMVPLEIMGRTRALIFTKQTSGREIINDGYDGYVVDPHDVNEVCAKIRIMIENVELRNKFAERGYRKIKECFSVDVIVDKLEKFYTNCII